MDLSRKSWREIAKACPIQMSEINYPADSKNGRVFRGGTLLVTQSEAGWMFFHPGLKGENIFISSRDGDLAPSYHGITMRMFVKKGRYPKQFYRYNVEGVYESIPVPVSGGISVTKEPVEGSILQISSVLFFIICITGKLLTLRPLCPSEKLQKATVEGKFEGY